MTPTSFTNFASGTAEVSPGLLVQITGSGLAPGVSGQVNASILSGKLPLTLQGVTVEFQWAGGSAFAPIYRVANENGVESVLIQAPSEITGTTVNAVVNVSGGSTNVIAIPVSLVSPGVLEDITGSRRAAVVIRSDGYAVTQARPARPGETSRMLRHRSRPDYSGRDHQRGRHARPEGAGQHRSRSRQHGHPGRLGSNG
ncbi:MAG: hypothetical protein QM757_40675 [Paludibaculum sp.]